MDFPKPNELSDLKSFILCLRSGNLLKTIETYQLNFQEKYNFLALKAKRSEEELIRQKLIIKQNSNLIEKFQNQLQELLAENGKLLEKQQSLNEENVTLREQLQSSEEKFAQLDIAYDQQVTLLSEKIQDLESQVATLETVRSQDISQFDQTQTELLAKTEQLNEDLKRELETLERQHNDERRTLKAEVANQVAINAKLQDQVKRAEPEIEDLQKKLAEAVSENKLIPDLKAEVHKLRYEQDMRLVQQQKENSSLTRTNHELKSKLEELKKNLLSKEQEVEELFIRYKERSRFAASEKQQMFGKYSLNKRSSTDDPKTIENSSDSDSSSISFYKPLKMRKKSMATDDESALRSYGNKRKSTNPRTNDGSSAVSNNQLFAGLQQHIVIPESPYSPVVSSSALLNPDQK